MVKAIQVGLGHWGSSWTKDVIPKVPNVQMVGYVDSNPEAIQRVQTELRIAESLCFLSLEEAMKASEAELAICTLRTEAHYPVVKRCLELGLSVIVEKPFASTIAQAKELVALAKETGRVLMVSQNYRHQPAPIVAAELIGAQRFGPVNLVSIDFRRHAPTQGYRYWDMPDPLLADMSIHHFDLMRMVLGDNPKRVSCRTWNSPASPFGHHPIGVATLEFEKGTIVSYRGSWMSSGPVTPWAGEWVMDCSEGQILWTSRDHFMGKAGPDRVTLQPLDGKPEPLALPVLEHTDRVGTLASVARVIETGTVPARFSSGEDNLHSLALVQATILSASRNGEWVELAEVLQ
ncbi:MAG: Gfo/Idh/MocA family oxidoreductase [Alphaproteobacteria bacterium]|nr:Gfo/Idh/MocA family oxidoreductase [Alphaproteobacteria bacterium]MBU1560793.1 Gfo/Idh/MocA family oxidoreductase [Alphaproteobacteria bacterium]MBU2304767.1 Gfo/Idh/MocA family oxidoreductase [Alphaproteobacteria bacterium]MBU2370063.1 Gfo/Idh/MocA family oxidoreductase [Alphaproteobacteria bacterium]